MSQPTNRPAGGPRLNLRGAVDLSSLKNPAPSAAGGGAQGGSGFVVDLTQETFPQIVQISSKVPVLVVFTSTASPASGQVVADLETVVQEKAGAVLLARVDIQRSPEVAQAFQVSGVPTLMAVLAGQPAPLFSGAASAEQIRDVVNQVITVAQQNGITGTLGTGAEGGDDDEATPVDDVPPHLVGAENALAEGDVATAVAAFEDALKQNPADKAAQEGLARAKFLQRVQDLDMVAVRELAAAEPKNVAAQLDAADLELYGGNVADAFNRLIDTVRLTAGDERETVRVRLVELFDVVGADAPEVPTARRALASALF